MIEILLTSILYPLGKKLGGRLLDHLANGIDNNLIQLLKDASKNKDDQAKVNEYLKNNLRQEEKLKENIQSFITDEDTINAIAISVPPKPGTLIQHYSELLELIGNTCIKAGREMVLKGFFNGKNFLSYFGVPSASCKIKIKLCKDGGLFPFDNLNIHLEKISEGEDINEKCIEMNEKIIMSRNKRIEYKTTKSLIEVRKIHLKWVEYEDGTIPKYFDSLKDFDSLTDEQKNECKIHGYDGVATMISSLNEQIGNAKKDIENFRNAVTNQDFGEY